MIIVTIVSVYWFRQGLFTLCLKVFKLFVFLMVSGRLFDKEGPMYDKVFCPVLDLLVQLSAPPVKFAEFLGTSILKNICKRLLLSSDLVLILSCFHTYFIYTYNINYIYYIYVCIYICSIYIYIHMCNIYI